MCAIFFQNMHFLKFYVNLSLDQNFKKIGFSGALGPLAPPAYDAGSIIQIWFMETFESQSKGFPYIYMLVTTM